MKSLNSLKMRIRQSIRLKGICFSKADTPIISKKRQESSVGEINYYNYKFVGALTI